MADELCDHHREVVGNLDHLDDVDHHTTANARDEFLKQCCQGRGRSLR